MASMSKASVKRITSICTAAVLLAAIPQNITAAEVFSPPTTPKAIFTIPQSAQPTRTSPIDILQFVPEAETQKKEDPNSRENILKLVSPIEVDAVTNTRADVYKDPVNRKYVTTLAKETKVKILRDKGEKHALVKMDDGQTGWMKYNALNISPTKHIIKEDLTELQKKLFVNYKEYASDTGYLIWVNLERQMVNVFKGSKGSWELTKAMICSSGKNTTPTINGEFKYYQMHRRINFDDYYVVNFMRYHDTFAIHSIPFKFNNKPYDDTLGTPTSHGCIRVSYNDIKWLSDNIPINTKIVIL